MIHAAKVLSLIIIIFCISSCSRAQTLRSAKVYAVPFESLYIVAQDANAIRKHPDVEVTINDQKTLLKVVKFLEIPCKKAVIQDKMDVRVVIDSSEVEGISKSREFSIGRFKDTETHVACDFAKEDEDKLSALIQQISRH